MDSDDGTGVYRGAADDKRRTGWTPEVRRRPALFGWGPWLRSGGWLEVRQLRTVNVISAVVLFLHRRTSGLWSWWKSMDHRTGHR